MVTHRDSAAGVISRAAFIARFADGLTYFPIIQSETHLRIKDNHLTPAFISFLRSLLIRLYNCRCLPAHQIKPCLIKSQEQNSCKNAQAQQVFPPDNTRNLRATNMVRRATVLIRGYDNTGLNQIRSGVQLRWYIKKTYSMPDAAHSFFAPIIIHLPVAMISAHTYHSGTDSK